MSNYPSISAATAVATYSSKNCRLSNRISELRERRFYEEREKEETAIRKNLENKSIKKSKTTLKMLEKLIYGILEKNEFRLTYNFSDGFAIQKEERYNNGDWDDVSLEVTKTYVRGRFNGVRNNTKIDGSEKDFQIMGDYLYKKFKDVIVDKYIENNNRSAEIFVKNVCDIAKLTRKWKLEKLLEK